MTPQENKKCPKCGAENPSDKGYLGECLCPCHQPALENKGKVWLENLGIEVPIFSLDEPNGKVTIRVSDVPPKIARSACIHKQEFATYWYGKNAGGNYLVDVAEAVAPKEVDNQLTIENRKVDDWEKEWKTARIRHFSQNTGEFPEIDGVLWVASDDVKSFIKSLLSSHTEKLRKEIEGILTDEINLAYTTKSGKTSRLTSAYNRISALLNNEEVK